MPTGDRRPGHSSQSTDLRVVMLPSSFVMGKYLVVQNTPVSRSALFAFAVTRSAAILARDVAAERASTSRAEPAPKIKAAELANIRNFFVGLNLNCYSQNIYG